jgi:plastocyanin
MKRACIAGVALIVAVAVSSVAAHHSPVMFDRSTTKTIVGTVVEFAWTNPHSSIQIDVPNDKGGVDRWGVELGSPQSMARNGWRSNILKAGDKITVTVNPLKSGEFGGIFVSLVLEDGRKLGGRATD